MTFGRFCYGVAATLLVSAAAIVISKIGGGNRPAPAERRGLSVPATVSLAAQEYDTRSSAEIRIGNASDAAFVLSDFSSSCSCVDLREAHATIIDPSSRVTVPAGASVVLTATVRALSTAGQPLTSSISFHTTDPALPAATVSILIPNITRKAYATPDAVSLGVRRVGADITSRVVIRSDSVKEIQSISCDADSVVVTARVATSQDAENDHSTDQTLDSPAAAVINLKIDSKSPRYINTVLRVLIATGGRPVEFNIPVTCRVVSAVETFPARVIFPAVVTPNGPAQIEVVIVSHDGPIESLTVQNPNPQLLSVAAAPSPPPPGRPWAVTITRANRSQATPAQTVRLQLDVVSDSKTHRVVVPVELAGAE